MSLEQIDDQIDALKAKKKRLEIKQAQELIKCLQKILGEAYSPDLVVGIVATAKDDSSYSEKKEAWLAAAQPFLTIAPQRVS